MVEAESEGKSVRKQHQNKITVSLSLCLSYSQSLIVWFSNNLLLLPISLI